MQYNAVGFMWPHDASFLEYSDLNSLHKAVEILVRYNQVFVVSPSHGQIAMAQSSAEILFAVTNGEAGFDAGA
jgi:hypothetical protein